MTNVKQCQLADKFTNKISLLTAICFLLIFQRCNHLREAIPNLLEA